MIPHHTPGPWVRWENDSEKYPSNIEIGEGNGFRIASVWDTIRDDVDANARLIAAAPDLLEACQALLHNMRQHQCEGGCHIEKARNAVAKAITGKTS